MPLSRLESRRQLFQDFRTVGVSGYYGAFALSGQVPQLESDLPWKWSGIHEKEHRTSIAWIDTHTILQSKHNQNDIINFSDLERTHGNSVYVDSAYNMFESLDISRWENLFLTICKLHEPGKLVAISELHKRREALFKKQSHALFPLNRPVNVFEERAPDLLRIAQGMATHVVNEQSIRRLQGQAL